MTRSPEPSEAAPIPAALAASLHEIDRSIPADDSSTMLFALWRTRDLLSLSPAVAGLLGVTAPAETGEDDLTAVAVDSVPAGELWSDTDWPEGTRGTAVSTLREITDRSSGLASPCRVTVGVSDGRSWCVVRQLTGSRQPVSAGADLVPELVDALRE